MESGDAPGSPEKVLDERGFADASLAANDGDAALPAGALIKQGGEFGQLLVALEQVYYHTLPDVG